jgi:hypothetical protein
MEKAYVLIVRGWGDGDDSGYRYFSVRFRHREAAQKALDLLAQRNENLIGIIIED